MLGGCGGGGVGGGGRGGGAEEEAALLVAVMQAHAVPMVLRSADGAARNR